MICPYITHSGAESFDTATDIEKWLREEFENV